MVAAPSTRVRWAGADSGSGCQGWWPRACGTSRRHSLALTHHFDSAETALGVHQHHRHCNRQANPSHTARLLGGGGGGGPARPRARRGGRRLRVAAGHERSATTTTTTRRQRCSQAAAGCGKQQKSKDGGARRQRTGASIALPAQLLSTVCARGCCCGGGGHGSWTHWNHIIVQYPIQVGRHAYEALQLSSRERDTAPRLHCLCWGDYQPAPRSVAPWVCGWAYLGFGLHRQRDDSDCDVDEGFGSIS